MLGATHLKDMTCESSGFPESASHHIEAKLKLLSFFRITFGQILSLRADEIYIRGFCSAGGFALELAHIQRIVETFRSHQIVV